MTRTRRDGGETGKETEIQMRDNDYNTQARATNDEGSRGMSKASRRNGYREA